MNYAASTGKFACHTQLLLLKEMFLTKYLAACSTPTWGTRRVLLRLTKESISMARTCDDNNQHLSVLDDYAINSLPEHLFVEHDFPHCTDKHGLIATWFG